MATLVENLKRVAAKYLNLSQRFSELNLTTLSAGNIEGRRIELTSVWCDYKKVFNDFIADASRADSTLTAEQIKKEEKRFLTLESDYFNVYGQLQDEYLNLTRVPKIELPPLTLNTTQVESSPDYMRVPTCDCPDFSGEYSNWPTFQDLFNEIYIKPQNISLIQKMVALKRKCKGPAEKIVQMYACTAENFAPAWKALQNYYENKRILVNLQLKHLMSLSTITKENCFGISNLYTTVNNCLESLKIYKIPTEHWDPLLVYIVSSKLPLVTLTAWEQSLSNPKEIPTWDQLHNFLQQRFRILEAISESSEGMSSSPSPRIQSGSANPNAKVRSFNSKTDNKQNQFDKNGSELSCRICKMNHPLRSCSVFLSKDVRTRQQLVRSHKYCFNCLSTSHFLSKCTSKHNCGQCGARHNSLLHDPTRSARSPSSSSIKEDTKGLNFDPPALLPRNHDHDEVKANVSFSSKKSKILLATAIVKINFNGSLYPVRALIDTGSEASFILESTRKKFQIPYTKVNAQVTGLGEVETNRCSKLCWFSIQSIHSKFTLDTQAYAVPKLVGVLPSHEINPQGLPEIHDFTQTHQLADPYYYKSQKIEMLIGADLIPFVLCIGMQKFQSNSVVAQETNLGWILFGSVPEKLQNNMIKIVSLHNDIFLEEEIKKFWEQEEILDNTLMSPEDDFCEKLYINTTTRDGEGKYIVRLPFKVEFPEKLFLSRSRDIAVNQFLRSERSFRTKPQLKITYNEVIKEYLLLGHMEKIKPVEKLDKDLKSLSCYLPHHGVAKPDSLTTKWRVVFNASSSTYNGTSLNDVLYVGPKLQNDLMMIILKWRKFPFVFTADIEKMYRQIWIDPSQTDFQRIVYRNNQDDDIQDFRLLTVTFGVNCAPYLAIRTLLKLADDESKTYPIGSNILKNHSYVDDIFAGSFDLAATISARKELASLLKLGCFTLKKWASNDKQILDGLPKEDIIFDPLKLEENDDDATVKTLGIYWESKEDYFTFKAHPFPIKDQLTKRQVFSNIARLFDPAGWLAPLIIKAKVMMQSIWKDKTDWDEFIKNERMMEYHRFFSTISSIDKIQIPRWYHFHPSFIIQYHGFCDASEVAYAAAVYIRVTDSNGYVFCSLVSAKSKVSPINVVSIPRLELCGAVLLAKLMKKCWEGLEISNFNTYFWTDSSIVLHWLKSPSFHWKTYVANRISKIQNTVGNIAWKHIRSEYNPADIASRGLFPNEILNHALWWHGPNWLSNHEETWPVSDIPSLQLNADVEEKPIKTLPLNVSYDDLIDRFSSYQKLIRVFCYIFRFLNMNMKFHRVKFKSTIITQEEAKFVKYRIISLEQRKFYANEYAALKSKTNVSKSSSLLTWNPFLDSHGVIRARGRLENADLTYDERFPILLPARSRFTLLILKYIHQITLHGKNKLMLNLVRKEFWIPRVQNKIKYIINNCKICYLLKKHVQTQLMGSLPPQRVALQTPFAFRNYVGVDYAGPIQIKPRKGRNNSRVILKGYVCVFVCFSTKAVHLEVVTDLTTEAFLAAFDRFISRRGLCNQVFSDNGTNFRGADNVLKSNFKMAIKRNVASATEIYAHRNITWNFIPPGTPHVGGLWEAAVRSLKKHLIPVLKNGIFTYEEMATILCKIEACLNSRPLTPLSNEVNELNPLTPGHFLTGDLLLAPPNPDLKDVNLQHLKRWQQIKSIQQTLCSRWKNEYLTLLHQRSKWKTTEQSIAVGDMVVIRNQNVGPLEWRLGRVLELHPGRDGIIRMLTLRTEKDITKRHVANLCFLPKEEPTIPLPSDQN